MKTKDLQKLLARSEKQLKTNKEQLGLILNYLQTYVDELKVSEVRLSKNIALLTKFLNKNQ